jgi:hypothetical protein
LVSLKKIILFLLLTSCAAYAQDEPDFSKEQRLHDIYTRFNEAPTDSKAWAGILRGKVHSYQVQKGDTLWGVSEILFADPQFWPKIWSLNVEGIDNPHEIYPTQAVQFTPGDMGEPPQMAVANPGAQGLMATENDENAEFQLSPEELQAQRQREETAILRGTVIPPTDKKIVPLGKIPQSIPLWRYREDKRQSVIFEGERIVRNFPPPVQILPYFLAEAQNSAIGKITETEMGFDSASEFQYVIVQLDEGIAPGTFLVVKDQGSLKSSFFGSRGYITQVQGQVEVLEKVNTGRNLYRAFVKRSVASVEVGAILVQQPLPVFETSDSGNVANTANAKIVGGQFAEDRKLFGTDSVVYLIGQGLSLNQTYPVFKQEVLRKENSKALENPRTIGRVKIVKLINDLATGIVLDASDDIRVGDTTFIE